MNVLVPFTEEQIAWIDARIKSGLRASTPPRVLQPGDVITSAEDIQRLPPGALVNVGGRTYERVDSGWVSPPLCVAVAVRSNEPPPFKEGHILGGAPTVSAKEHLRVQNALAEALADRKFLVEKVEDMRRIVESIGKGS